MVYCHSYGKMVIYLIKFIEADFLIRNAETVHQTYTKPTCGVGTRCMYLQKKNKKAFFIKNSKLWYALQSDISQNLKKQNCKNITYIKPEKHIVITTR